MIIVMNTAIRVVSSAVTSSRYVRVSLKLPWYIDESDELLITSLYAPVDRAVRKVFSSGDEFAVYVFNDRHLVAGDFNDFANPQLDRYPVEWTHWQHHWRRHLSPLLEERDYIDF